MALTKYYMCGYRDFFPERAEHETRVMTILDHPDIPQDDYALMEVYCPDPDCDCRRVIFNVMSLQRGHMATISYGFDRDEEDAGPFLDPFNPQSDYSDALMEMVTNAVLSDTNYLARLEKHYQQVKDAVKNPDSATRKILKAARAGGSEKIGSEKMKLKIGQKKLARRIDRYVKRADKKGGNEEVIKGMIDYMPTFKKLIQTSTVAELEEIFERYPGLHDFSKLLGNLTDDGVIEVPE